MICQILKNMIFAVQFKLSLYNYYSVITANCQKVNEF